LTFIICISESPRSSVTIPGQVEFSLRKKQAKSRLNQVSFSSLFALNATRLSIIHVCVFGTSLEELKYGKNSNIMVWISYFSAIM